MKRVLMVAYHFPPHSGTSGVQRALRFSSYLPDFGWEPIVLTANPRVYDHVSTDLCDEVRNDMPVIRAGAFDTRKDFSFAGKYPAFLARPDRWKWWSLFAVPAGMKAIRRYRPDAIWSTYPIATAHTIGTRLAMSSGLPLVADFRDPMAQEGYPSDPATWKAFERIERDAISCAARSVFTTPGARDLYRQRYPAHSNRLRVIENGYDENVFEDAVPGRATSSRKLLVHSGVVYPSERDPTQLFEALALLKRARPELFGRLVLRFRASSAEDLIANLAAKHDVASAVELAPSVTYADAIAEMQSADGLLVLQASNCNAQIPAKTYEYLRARRPMLVLTDPAGDTAAVVRKAGIESIAPLDNPQDILELLVQFLEGGSIACASDDAISAASRYARTRELAMVLAEAEHED